MKPFKDRSIFLLILLPLWAGAAIGVFRAEWVSLKVLGAVMFDDERKMELTQKPIDRLSLQAESLIPPGSRFYFFDPYHVESPAGGFYAGRLRYQLYQRKMTVVNPGQEFDYSVMKPGEFVLFIWPDGGRQAERDLLLLAPLEELYRHEDARGSQAIYRVGGAPG